MTDDFSAVSGEQGGYVPCDEVALAPTPPDKDSVAVYGEDAGYVAAATAASPDISDETDEQAVYGRATGYVPGPCDCPDPTILSTFTWNNLHVGPSGTVWTGTRTDRTGAGSFTHQTGGSPATTSQWITLLPGEVGHTETERRGYASIEVGTIVGATHYRLNATLRNYIYVTHETYVQGNQAAVDWEFVAGAWGMGTPTWDGGTLIGAGSISPLSWFFDDDGIVVVPVNEIEISVTWAATPPYAQWYFRNVSERGYRDQATFAPLFTPGATDLRYPNDTLVNSNLIELRSFIAPAVTTSSAFEDWTLEVLECA